MAEKVLTYDEFTESIEKTPETVIAYHEYLKTHPNAKDNFLKKDK